MTKSNKSAAIKDISVIRIIGLMSGTSLDGLDIASCIFSRTNEVWKYEIEEAECISYDKDWTAALKHAPHLNGNSLIKLDADFGLYIGTHINGFRKRLSSPPALIASHGHTVFHEPVNHISLQIGHGAAISAATKLPVVCDFRSLDVASGGQGAPLVPAADKLLFGEYDYCLNLGGIANISHDEKGIRTAYDVCPCNLLLNRLAEQAGKPFDKGGNLARQGTINQSLLNELNDWQYYALAPPKSLDKETLLKELLPMLEGQEIPVSDKLGTVTEHIAIKVAKAISGKGKMLITGGGAFNDFLIDRIRAHTDLGVIVPDEKLVSYKEALAFAFLGLMRMLNEPNCLKSVTGAGEDTVGGALYGDFSKLTL